MSTLMKKVILWLLTMIILAACTPTTEETAAPQATIAVERPTPTLVVEAEAATPATEDVMIRIYNQTNRDLIGVRVQFPEQIEEYGPLADGTSSDFHVIDQAYRYAYVEVQIQDVIEVLQPIDYVGEALLAPGFYTYILRMSGGNLTLDLAEGDEELPTQPSLESLLMIVSGETAVCDDNPSQTCLLVKYNRNDKWELFFDPIGGFHYQPGYEYELLVYKFTTTTRLADGRVNHDVRYEMKEILAQTGETAEATAVIAETETTSATTDTPESIIILNPGPLSQITSPVALAGESDFPFEGTLEVQILAFAEGGTAVVGTGFAMLNGEFGERSPYEGIVEFTPPTEPTPGRVIVISTSPMHGQAHHLASVPVTLLPAGETADIKPANAQPEAIAIHSPALGENISGGTINITGYAAPTFEQNLGIEILDEQGTVVGSGFTTIAAGMGESGSFEAAVAYTVTELNNGSVCVQDLDALDGNMIHRTCVTVNLSP